MKELNHQLKNKAHHLQSSHAQEGIGDENLYDLNRH